MFRLASLIGVACLALAACVLARTSAPASENESLEDPTNTDQNFQPERQVRPHGGLYYAQFSVN
jgi:hypothetical protein